MSTRIWKHLAAVALLIATLTSIPAPGTGVRADNSTRDLTATEFDRFAEFLLLGHADQAERFLNVLEPTCDGEPLYLLARGRALIERIPTDEHKQDYTREVSEPALAVFDQVIELCSQRMDDDDPDPRLRLYRGWAWMQKSHIRALGRKFYRAGRDAGKGKGDLERYLEAFPDDPQANGLLGAFLYFTDAIPSLFKFLSKLMFLPTGDRTRGLEMINIATQSTRTANIEYQQLRAYVLLYFEGRYEEGFAGEVKLLDRYPFYPRGAVGLAIASPFDPIALQSHHRRVYRFLDEYATRESPVYDTGVVSITRVARAYTERLLGNPENAVERFRGILTDRPERADWVEPFAQFQLGMLYAGTGRADEARLLLELAIDHKRSDLFSDPAGKVLKDLDEYDGDLESVSAALQLGDQHLLRGELEAAAQAFTLVIERVAPAWLHSYQMIACERMAELLAGKGEYQRALEYLDRALEFYQNEYRLDWMLGGRRNHFERLLKGDAALPLPTLLSVDR